MTLHTEPGDDAILAAGALDYVSFSYYRSNVCSTETRMNVIGGDPNPYLELTRGVGPLTAGAALPAERTVGSLPEAAVYCRKRSGRSGQSGRRWFHSG